MRLRECEYCCSCADSTGRLLGMRESSILLVRVACSGCREEGSVVLSWFRADEFSKMLRQNSRHWW